MEIVFQNSTSDKKYSSRFFEKVLNSVVKTTGLRNKNIQVSVSLVEGRKIRSLNNKYRHKDRVTDVLSFPMAEKKEIHDPKTKVGDLGDVFICLPFAKKEAKRENIDIERKLARLTAHGFLHLIGYDHETSKAEEKKMLELEDKILTSLNK